MVIGHGKALKGNRGDKGRRGSLKGDNEALNDDGKALKGDVE